MDYGERIAERAIGSVYRTIHRTYQNASRDLTDKLAVFTRKSAAREKVKLEQLAKGIITEQDFKDWRLGQQFMEKQWKDKIDQCARIMTEANKEAASVVHGKRLDVFAENYNHAAYELERQAGNVGFETYSAETVARLIKEKPQMLPKWKINEKKDYLWNYRKVENTVKQGIIQGEGINQITERLVESLCTQNEDKMRTFARTAVTGAQNAGRQAQMEDAEELGVQLMKRWVATLDDRTREAHADLDGQEVAVDESFSVDVDGEHYEIQYPGDPSADPCMVYNCRCTMIQVYKGIDRTSVRRDMDDNEVVDMTYKEWKEAKQNGTLDTDKKLVEPPIKSEQQNGMNAPLIEKHDGKFAVISNEQEGTFRVETEGVLDKTVERIEMGELFDQTQAIETAETLEKLQEEYPLDKPLQFVGDMRVEQGLPLDMDITDIQYEYPKYGGFSAKYTPTKDGGGKIWIASENLNTEKLVNELDMRHELRLKYMDDNGMLSVQNAFDVVSDTIEGTIDHEYAHALQEMFLGAASGSGSEALSECFNELNDYLDSNKEKVLQISKYATTHPFEMLAESFVQMRDVNHPDTVATRTAKEVWSIFEKYMGKRGK